MTAADCLNTSLLMTTIFDDLHDTRNIYGNKYLLAVLKILAVVMVN